VRPVSGTCWGVHTGPTHSNMSESDDVRLVVHCRSTRGIGRRRVSGGPHLVTQRQKHPLCIWVQCVPDASGGT